MKKVIIISITLLLLSILTISFICFKAYQNYISPTNNPEQVIIIKKGQNLTSIISDLKSKHLIESPLLVRIFARLQNQDKLIKSGEYQIPRGTSPKQIINIITSGETIVHHITFAEGLTSLDYAKQLNSTQNLSGHTDPIPENGTLLPETYNYSYNDTRQSIFSRMKQSFNENAYKLWKTRSTDTPITSLDEARILASLIEREAVVTSERAIIASVFINRLKKNMPLQSDPTVIFAVTGGNFDLNRPLTSKDLKIDSPFNTYIHKGLPPTPICNFRLDSLKAALNPAKTNYLYFVANPNKPGEHLFSTTYHEHQNKAEQFHKYIRSERKKLSSQ